MSTTPGEGVRDRAPDATPRAPASLASLDSRDLYRLLVESVRDYAIYALDPRGYILSWNAGAERFKGYTREEVLGRHFSTFYTDEDVAGGKPARALRTAEVEGRFEGEGWRVRKDGTRFWASVLITALRHPNGELAGFAKVTRDLTERRRAARTLQESEDRFRVLVQNVKDYGIFMLDPGGHVVSWNEGAERINGWTREEIEGRHFSTFYPPEDNAWNKPAWELEEAVEHGRFEDEGWRLRKDGTRFWANVIITPLYEDERLLGFAKVTRDLTERRAAEERALADSRRLAAAEAASRTKGEFLASMSHELRTPLNAIGGYAELMAMGVHGPLNDAQLRDLERITRSQRHLLAIINDILNFSRVEAGHVAYDLGRVELRALVAGVLDLVEAQASNSGVRLAAPEAGPPVVAWADSLKVEQIVLNLLSNAVKFTGPGGQASATCAIAKGRAVVTVEDTGEGIPAEKHESIFEPFVQLGRSLTTGHEGTGLGLAISRDLARAMGGDLVVRSEPGQGAAFILTLPLAENG